MQEDARRERRAALAQETCMTVNWYIGKTAEIELPKAVLGIFFFKAEIETLTTTVVNKLNVIVALHVSFRFVDPAGAYLWPLPFNEIGLRPNFKLNPGW